MSVDSVDRLPFPAVTVCNMNPVPRSRLLCSNFDMATVDEHLSNYVQSMNQNDSLDEHISELRLNTAPVSKCINTTHLNVLGKRSIADVENAKEASSVTNILLSTRDIDESSKSIMVEPTTAIHTNLASIEASKTPPHVNNEADNFNFCDE